MMFLSRVESSHKLVRRLHSARSGAQDLLPRDRLLTVANEMARYGDSLVIGAMMLPERHPSSGGGAEFPLLISNEDGWFLAVLADPGTARHPTMPPAPEMGVYRLDGIPRGSVDLKKIANQVEAQLRPHNYRLGAIDWIRSEHEPNSYLYGKSGVSPDFVPSTTA